MFQRIASALLNSCLVSYAVEDAAKGTEKSQPSVERMLVRSQGGVDIGAYISVDGP